MSLLLTNPAANHLTKRKEKTMIKRLLNYSPKEMLQLTSEELFYAMKMDEGRTVEGPCQLCRAQLPQGYIQCRGLRRLWL